VLTGARMEVVGRTDEDTGTATVDAGQLTAAEIVVQTGAITTDQSARDAYFRRALDTTTHPQATFTLDQPVDVSAVGDGTGPLVVQAPGTLVIGSSSVQVLADLQIQRNAGRLEVAGSIPLVLSDLGLTAPDLGFVTVDPDGSVEVLLLLVR
ncbi:MAG TPA: YceI family protein, partial [Actinotalea sp.]|nr:YceI family protein [Actinotalea sp.]